MFVREHSMCPYIYPSMHARRPQLWLFPPTHPTYSTVCCVRIGIKDMVGSLGTKMNERLTYGARMCGCWPTTTQYYYYYGTIHNSNTQCVSVVQPYS